MESGGGAEVRQQRLQPSGEVHGEGDVVAGIGAEPCQRARMGVAVDTGVHSHDQSVLHGHGCLLVHHVRFEGEPLGEGRRPGQPLFEQCGGFVAAEFEGAGVMRAVIRGDRAVLDEIAAPGGHRCQVAVIA